MSKIPESIKPSGPNCDFSCSVRLDSVMDAIDKHVRNVGHVRCLTSDCVYHNYQQGCWLSGSAIINGVCECYIKGTAEEHFPVIAKKKAAEVVQE